MTKNIKSGDHRYITGKAVSLEITVYLMSIYR